MQVPHECPLCLFFFSFALPLSNLSGFVRGAPKTGRRNEISYFQKYLTNNVCIFGVV